ncbi:MAG: MarR family transcriptional regulator [Eggerthellaceae bacterium]|nr:MarR family transcriptional regulator [Eggerthellaceae bacterium]
MEKKELLFSSEFATILIETNRLIDKAVEETVGFSSTDYCILQQLFASEKEIELMAIRDFFLLKPNSVTTAVARLEKRGYLIKRPMAEDQRAFYVEITEAGIQVAEEASVAIREVLTKRTWKQDPKDNRINDCMMIHASLFYKNNPSLQNIRLDDNYFVVPGWVNGLKIIQQLWTHVVKNRVQLPLGAYRILTYLIESGTPKRQTDIARYLFFDNSAISQFLKNLKEGGYITSEISKNDKRSTLIGVTKSGKHCQQTAFDSLSEATAHHFESLSNTDIETLNTWHYEMWETLYL